MSSRSGERELPVTWHQRTAIVMAGEHRTAEAFERLEKTDVAQMRDIENHSDAFELAQQVMACGTERAVHEGIVVRASRYGSAWARR